MEDDLKAWSEALEKFRPELAQFGRRVRELERNLTRAMRSPHDYNAALAFLQSLDSWSGIGPPDVPGREEWRRRWQARREEAVLEFEAAFRS